MVRKIKPVLVFGLLDDPAWVRAMEHRCSLPSNFETLPDWMKVKIEEDCYRKMLMFTNGRLPGDPLLRSMAADGTRKKGYFGVAVKGAKVEEGD